jgi:ubiquinone/menaquinone biosynthesis C-methylase UbiE
MGFYSRVIFPRLCELLLGGQDVTRRRREVLADAEGEVLEIGVGTGLNLPHYPGGVRKIVTVDPNPGMHQLARRRARRSRVAVEQHVSRGERLPFADGRFDCVVSTFTLCSIADVPAALAEAYRVLKPGGKLLFLEHGLSPEPGVQKWQRRLNRLETILADGCHLDRDVEGLIAASPFTSLRIEGSYLEGMPRTHGYLYRGVAVK